MKTTTELKIQFFIDENSIFAIEGRFWPFKMILERISKVVPFDKKSFTMSHISQAIITDQMLLYMISKEVETIH